MIFNHMPDWLYSSKKLTASAKLLMERIFTLSCDGTQTVFIARSAFADKLGMSVRTLSNAFKELESAGLIEDLPSTNRWDRTRNFRVTAKACLDTSEPENFARSSAQNLQDREGKNCNIEVEKTATSKLQNLQDREGKNCNVEVAEVASSNLQTLQDLHQIEIRKKLERNIYSTNGALTTTTYPKSTEECEQYFRDYVNKYISERPILQHLPLKMEAEKFFNYWSVEKKWKRGRTAVKSVSGCVATWIGNWIDRNQRNFASAMKPMRGSTEELMAFAKKCCDDAGVPFEPFTPTQPSTTDANVIEINDLLELAK